MNRDAACVMLLVIGRQESCFAHRAQVDGPARGLWQFKVAGVRGVMHHPRSAAEARYWCELNDFPCATTSVYHVLRTDDVFACGMARLLLWTDRSALPAVGDEDAAWSRYPFRPHLARVTTDCRLSSKETKAAAPTFPINLDTVSSAFPDISANFRQKSNKKYRPNVRHPFVRLRNLLNQLVFRPHDHYFPCANQTSPARTQVSCTV